MPAGSTEQAVPRAGSLAALAASDGCARHPLIARLILPGVAGRDLADAVHALCSVHGRHAGLFEQADRGQDGGRAAWLDDAAAAFDIERSYLARLTAAVGPLPSTPGQAESDAAFAAQRHAFDMLACSDRTGCATGAAVALATDWRAFRHILDAAAHRAGTPIVPPQMPDDEALAAIAALPAPSPAVQRALAFGAQQAFAQHRGLCDLIEARASARDRLESNPL